MTTPSPTPVIEAAGVTYAYDRTPVLEDVSLAIHPGEFVGLIGPNGSGKTTLLKLLLGLLIPDAGTVRLYGEPAHTFPDGERLGYVPQEATKADRSMPITVREVVRMGRYPHRGLRRLTAADNAIVDEALDRVGIRDLADRRVGRLSGGQRQRVYIARALASEAQLLALDEPTVGVDADTRDRFYDLLDALNADGITIIMIEHDLGIVREHADTVVCINRQVHHHGPPDTVLNDPTLAKVYQAPEWAASPV